MLRLPEPAPEPLQFASKGERACGLVLERYIEGFRLIPGQTFQVPIGYGKTCDFMVGGVFVEFHPMVLRHDFDDRQAYRRFWQGLRRIKSSARDVIVAAVADELAEKYYRRRQFLCRLTAGKDSELIVCRNGVDVYEAVIRRFAKELPSRKQFLLEFDKAKE